MGMREGSRRWAFGIVFVACWLAAATAASEPTQGSLRLVVKPESAWVLVGHSIRVTVGLRDARDQPSPAPTAFAVALAVTPPVPGAAATVTIPAGQSAATLQLQPAKLGILEIRATHPQAFEGDAFVRVAARAPSTRHAPPRDAVDAGTTAQPAVPSRLMRTPASTPLAGAPAPRPRLGSHAAVNRGVPARGAPTGSGAAPSSSASAPDFDAPARPLPASPPPAPPVSGGGSTSAPPGLTGAGGGSPSPPRLDSSASAPAAVRSGAPATAPPSAATSEARPATTPATDAFGSGNPRPHLVLRYSPQRKLLADGRDAVTIQAFTVSDDPDPAGSADGEFKVRLFASSGTLVPLPLVIHGGDGSSTLTTTQPGDVDVEFLDAQPDATLDGDRHLRIHFGAPVHGIRVEAKPPEISLVDDTYFVVTLLDADGHSVATDEPLAVQLALDKGRGAIKETTLSFKPGDFVARTRFTAAAVGEVAVSAAAPSLLNQTARLDVRLPLGLLLLSIAGGLVGGVLAFYRRRNSRLTRIAVGGVTGFLLYWAFMFGVVRVLPSGVVLNSLSNFALSTIGGWMGTEVFTLLLRWLGLKKPAAHAEHATGKHEPHAERAGGEHEPHAEPAEGAQDPAAGPAGDEHERHAKPRDGEHDPAAKPAAHAHERPARPHGTHGPHPDREHRPSEPRPDGESMSDGA